MRNPQELGETLYNWWQTQFANSGVEVKNLKDDFHLGLALSGSRDMVLLKQNDIVHILGFNSSKGRISFFVHNPCVRENLVEVIRGAVNNNLRYIKENKTLEYIEYTELFSQPRVSFGRVVYDEEIYDGVLIEARTKKIYDENGWLKEELFKCGRKFLLAPVHETMLSIRRN